MPGVSFDEVTALTGVEFLKRHGKGKNQIKNQGQGCDSDGDQ